MNISIDIESMGKAWFSNIYSKVETIVQEVDDFVNPTSDKNASGNEPVSSGSRVENLNSGVVQDTHDESRNPSNIDPQCSRHPVSQASENPSPVSGQCEEPVSSGSRVENLNSEVVQNTHDGSGNPSIIDPQCSRHLVPPASENPSLVSGQSNFDQNLEENSVNKKSCQGVDDDSLISEVLSTQAFCDVGSEAVPCEEKIEKDVVDLFNNSALAESHFTCGLCEVSVGEVACTADGVCSDECFSCAILPLQSDMSVPNVRYEETIENVKLSTDLMSTNSIGEQANLPTGELDASSLENIELYDAANPEERSTMFDESLLYAVWRRTQKHRSFKKKIMDSLASKKKLQKEYEQLAIWFGDTEIGCNSDSFHNFNSSNVATVSQSRSSQTNCTEDDSEWEIL